MKQLIPSPSAYLTKSPDEWTPRDLFEREVDWYCQGHARVRYRSKEWVEFTERFVPYCQDWRGCWVAERAWIEFTLYLSLPEGEYYPEEYDDDWDFRTR
jgi:hypothetical protein